MKKNPQQTEMTKKILIDAFCILLKKKPVEKISVREISDRAGYNRSTFYQYFQDVFDIRDSMENIILSQVKENFQKNISPDNFEETFLKAFTKIQTENEKFFDLLFNSRNQAHFFEKLFEEVSPIFMEKFNLPTNNLKSKFLAEIYLQTVLTAVKIWIKDERKISVEEFTKFLRDILTSGILMEIEKLR